MPDGEPSLRNRGKPLRSFTLFIVFLLTSLVALGEAASPEQDFVIGKYLSAQEQQREKMKGVQMEVEIDASIPKLAKKGTMNALRVVSNIGKITYDALRFDGDNTVKKEVIARFLAGEAQGAAKPDPKIAINPENYKFKLKGLQVKDDKEVYVMEVKPRKKRVGVFKGELWLDPETYLAVRESGQFVKSPSIFLKKIEFIREFIIENGVAVPTKMISYADTRIVGRTELNISYRNFTKIEEHHESETTGGSASVPSEPSH